MQTDEVELFTPSILENASMMTPDIVSTAPATQSIYNPLHAIHESLSISDLSSQTTNETASSASSADVKVSKIEDQLKQSLNEARKPTPSPFETISSTQSVFDLDKPMPAEDGGTIEIPSTADVVKELEAMTNTNIFQVKTLINESNERGAAAITLNGDYTRYDSPPSLKGANAPPPKKGFLHRSQSHTEPTSPQQNNPNLLQSQKANHDNSISNAHNGLDTDGESMTDSVNHHFTRTADLRSATHSNGVANQQFKPTIDTGNDQQLNSIFRSEQNNHAQTLLKQQPIVMNHKRTFANNIPTLTKASTIIIPQAALNEVTSTDQSSSVKRQRTGPIPSNTITMNFRPSPGAATVTNALPSTSPNGSGSDDQRKKQIRDSNREAARRCRERRRQYIEQLEGNLEQHKGQIKQLTDKLARVERENTQLRAILSEAKILHSSARLSVNESHVDYANVISASGMDLQSESSDGVTITRNYISRNNL